MHSILIYLRFRSSLFGNIKRAPLVRGFSLIELVVASAIMLVVVSAVVIQFTSFDSSILLRSLGYEVALTIRQAQTFSLGVLGDTSENFSRPYGVSFTPQTQSYVLFGDDDSDDPPSYDGNITDIEVTEFAIGRTLQIADTCIYDGSTLECAADGVDRLDISFERPEFTALFHVDGSPSIADADISEARIILDSTDGGEAWRVSVSSAGQITVCLDSACP